MGLFDRVERKLESVVNGAFARAFKAEVQPVEIASAMRRAMDDQAAVVSKGRTIVPNHFTVELAPKDYERLITFEGTLTNELVASVEEHAESQRFVPGGPMAVHFTRDDALETGVFRVVADTDASPAAPSPAAPAAPPPPAAAAVDAAAEAKHRRATPADDDAAAAAPTPEPPRPPLKTNADEPSPAEHAEEEHDTYRPRRSIPSRARQHEAAAPAEGAISMASHAASAAGGALAGTAAAGRAGTPHGHLPDDADELDATPAPADPAPAPAPPPPPPPNAQVNPVERPWLDVDGDSYPLLGALTVIGRDTSADITLNDPGISRRHCEVRVTPDGRHLKISVRDLGSTNGTFVNGERVTSQHVEPGDRLTLGRLSLHLRSGRR